MKSFLFFVTLLGVVGICFGFPSITALIGGAAMTIIIAKVF